MKPSFYQFVANAAAHRSDEVLVSHGKAIYHRFLFAGTSFVYLVQFEGYVNEVGVVPIFILSLASTGASWENRG